MSRKLALAVLGIGLGLSLGALTDGAAHRYAWAALIVGLALFLVPVRKETSLGAPADDGSANRRSDRDDKRPTLAGLGTRVEQILRLAEEQANDYRTEARREAEEIRQAARVDADEILGPARDRRPATPEDDSGGPPTEVGSAGDHR
ncbi:hypothetical protein BDK92_4517 [Micromonospora pisi]|uniref:Uncharacterized protein n=1 Tax=Micromonospora pisi TaxID=589240 RepID=A0A495JQ21_9ACTN|nr:hypothetical protein BDK92_4517 [Micromonospora pisi]